MKPRALFLHGGPGLSDYLDSLEEELRDVFEIERYAQAPHHDVPAFVDEALEHLERPAWLVGHSWGGRLAFEIAATGPQNVLGIVAIDTLGALGLGGWDEVGEPMNARLTDEERARREATESSLEGLEIMWPAYFSSREATPPMPEISIQEGVLTAVYEWIEANADPPEMTARLLRFDRPVLALHGAEDAIPLHVVEETVAACPDAELVVFDGVAHFPWIERPGCVRDATVDFLASRSS